MNSIFCKNHGHQAAKFICQHGTQLDETLYELDSNGRQGEPDAWCYECHTLHDKENGFTEKVEESTCTTAICAVCYEERLISAAPLASSTSSAWWQFWKAQI